jgi:hypothetical protein
VGSLAWKPCLTWCAAWLLLCLRQRNQPWHSAVSQAGRQHWDAKLQELQPHPNCTASFPPTRPTQPSPTTKRRVTRQIYKFDRAISYVELGTYTTRRIYQSPRSHGPPPASLGSCTSPPHDCPPAYHHYTHANPTQPRDDVYGAYDASYLHTDGPKTATQSPIVTGTSVIAIKYKDGVVMAADNLGAIPLPLQLFHTSYPPKPHKPPKPPNPTLTPPPPLKQPPTAP